MKTKSIAAVRGMRDILPDEAARWRRLEGLARECMRLYGYGEIRTPIVERAALFDRLGGATEIVEKQMYQFVDKLNGDSLALRPEATAAVARAAIDQARGGAKLFYMGPMFRHERPQKGRQRQFHQIGAEALGCASPDIDVEMILLCRRLWRMCGVEGRLRLRLNNLGAREERARFAARLADYLESRRDELDEFSRQRARENPLRALDSKDEKTRAVCRDAPPLADFIGAESRAHYEEVTDRLRAAEVDFEETPTLVRGLDYYNLTVFEWVFADAAGAQDAVCGGGRYDGLAGEVSGVDAPGCGFALGMERLLDLMGRDGEGEDPPDVFLFAVESDAAGGRGLAAFADEGGEAMRAAGLSVWRDMSGGNLSRRLKKAAAKGARLAAFVGADELRAGEIKIRRLADGAQKSAPPLEAATRAREWSRPC